MRKPSNIMPVLAFLFFTLLASPSQLLAGQYQVTRVIDGDTIKMDDGTKKITVRLVGIDAPEVSHARTNLGSPSARHQLSTLRALS